MLKIKQFTKAASVAALSFGIAFYVQPTQKASAQVITGAGASSVTTLLNSSSSPVLDYATSFGFPYRYVVTGSGVGRIAFLNGDTDFVATDGLGTSFGADAFVLDNAIVGADRTPIIDPFTGEPYVVVNEATLNVAFPYNVRFPDGSGFDVVVTGEQACRIIRGDASQGDPQFWDEVTNASGVQGPFADDFGNRLPIIRVARGDSSGTTDTLQGRGSGSGFIGQCNAGGFNIPSINGAADSSVIAPDGEPLLDRIFIDGVDSGKRVRETNIDDGTRIPNQRSTDIIVAAASDPFGSGDDNNSGSYTLGVIGVVSGINGAIGYTETAAAQGSGYFSPFDLNYTSGFGLAVDNNAPGGPTSTIALGPTFIVFRKNYFDDTRNAAAQTVCYGATFSGFLNAAGFAIDNTNFPFNPDPTVSPEASVDTDNYGSLGELDPADFGPCSTIGS